MVLPRLARARCGRSQMVFFQHGAAGGYDYAARTTASRRGASVVIHLAVMSPLLSRCHCTSQADGARRPPRRALVAARLFAMSIGLPFFALAANGTADPGVVPAPRSSGPKDLFLYRPAMPGAGYLSLQSRFGRFGDRLGGPSPSHSDVICSGLRMAIGCAPQRLPEACIRRASMTGAPRAELAMAAIWVAACAQFPPAC